jgi:hypothetical protein
MTISRGEYQGHIIETPDFWVRIRVANAGRNAAKDVEVIVRDLCKRDPTTGAYIADPIFLPLSIKWSHIGKPQMSQISPGVEKHCDLLHIPDPSRTPEAIILNAPAPTTAILELEVRPNANPGLLSAGDYSLVILATASNLGSPTRREITFSVPEQWSSDGAEMAARIAAWS